MHIDQRPSDLGHIVSLTLQEIHASYSKADEMYRLFQRAIASGAVQPADTPIEWWPNSNQSVTGEMLRPFLTLDRSAYEFLVREASVGIALSELALTQHESPATLRRWTAAAGNAHTTVMQFRAYVLMDSDEAQTLAILVTLLHEKLLKLALSQR